MDTIILTMPTGLMLTCNTSKCEVEICNFDNIFFNQNDCGTPMNKLCCTCMQQRSEFCILVPEESSVDCFCINFLAIISANNSRWHHHFEQT